MRLYKMELLKLFQNKIFKIGMLATTGLLFLYFWFAEVGGEISTVDGKFYSGYEAVQMNRKITEEFEGDLTDEKVNQIIEKYGLPAKLEENMPGWRDGNFLNDFVIRYFTNGAWENGVLPTERYFLGETELGKAYDEIGKTPYLAYTTGWKVFVEMLQFGLILGSILIICGVSTIFAEESQTKMLPLIFSTEEGRRKDVPAKILASFTFTIFIFMWFALVNLVLCWMIYGLKGFENISWMVLSQHMLQPVLFLKYLGILLGLAFQALLSLYAITLCVSAYQDSSFGAVIIVAVCWGLPVLIRMFFGGVIWLIVDSMPIFLVMTGIVNDIYEIWYIVLGINVCFAIGVDDNQNLLFDSLYSASAKGIHPISGFERECTLVKYGKKFHPVKKYAIDLADMTPSNRDKWLPSTRKWYLKIEGLYRDFIEKEAVKKDFQLSQEYCMILTIRDPEYTAPVYDEVTQQLTNRNFIHHDVRVRNVVHVTNE